MKYLTVCIIIISLFLVVVILYKSMKAPVPEEVIITLKPKPVIVPLVEDRRELPFSLIGTVGDTGSEPFAIIKNKNTDEEGFYGIGNKISGYEVADISRGKVVFLKNGRSSILEFSSGAVSEVVISLSSQEKIVNRKALLRRIPTLTDALETAKPLPYIENGRIKGVVVADIKDPELFDKIGLREGDIVLEVNGEKVDSLKKVFQLYHKFKNNTTFTIEVKRSDEIHTLTYHMN